MQDIKVMHSNNGFVLIIITVIIWRLAISAIDRFRHKLVHSATESSLFHHNSSMTETTDGWWKGLAPKVEEMLVG